MIVILYHPVADCDDDLEPPVVYFPQFDSCQAYWDNEAQYMKDLSFKVFYGLLGEYLFGLLHCVVRQQPNTCALVLATSFRRHGGGHDWKHLDVLRFRDRVRENEQENQKHGLPQLDPSRSCMVRRAANQQNYFQAV